MIRSPFMRAAFQLACGMALLSAIPLLVPHLVRFPAFGALLGAVSGALMGAGMHASWWPLHVSQGSPEAMPVRGLSETIRDLAPRMGTPEIVGGRAVSPRHGWEMVTIVEGVELQIHQELLMEPWPWVKTLLATTLAGTALHRRLRRFVIGAFALVGGSVATAVVMVRHPGALAGLIVILFGALPATAVGRAFFRREVLRRKRQILLTETDVEDGDFWPLGPGY